MAPNITGIVDADQANAAALAERAIGFSARVLGKGGIALVKLFEGGEALRIRRLGETLFYRSVVRKPQASRDKSREIYLLLRQPRA
jgi:23S rRNA (uridine2552-2'-O)-methyltransferase